MTAPENAHVRRIVGVYNADGSILGELRFLVGRALGGRHCELCDITHGRVRTKSAFAALQVDFGVPIEVVHLDERSSRVASFTSGRTPCVVAETADGYRMLVEADDPARCHGDVGTAADTDFRCRYSCAAQYCRTVCRGLAAPGAVQAFAGHAVSEWGQRREAR